MDYKVSVIIPTYNVENHIEDTIKSVINQTIGFENIELLIMDDGSTDSTKDILTKYSQKYDNIKCFFPKQNSGTPSRGRNMGIDNASSEYVMFLDSDDKYVENMCEVLLNVIIETGKDIVICNHKVINNNNFMVMNDECNQDKSYKIYNSEDEIIFHDAYMWNKIFRKSFLNKFNIRGFEKYFAEDSYFCIKSYLHTDEVVYLENFIGYQYNVRDMGSDASLNNGYDYNGFCKFLKGFYKIIKLIKNEKRQDLINLLMKKEFVVIISQYVRLNIDYSLKIDLLNELFKFDEYSQFNGKLIEKWADIFLKLLKQRKFKLIIIYSKFLKFFYNSNFIRKFYRRVYGKN